MGLTFWGTIATSSGSAASYVREGITNIKVGMYLEMFTITGAIFGATTQTLQFSNLVEPYVRVPR